MPVPVSVSPGGQESSRGTDGAAGGEDGTVQHHTTATQPQPQQQGEAAAAEAAAAEAADPDVVAGYQDCLKETLRFLVEEERLPGDHPVVRGLVTHLTRQHAHVELTKLSQQMTAAPAPASPLNAGYQVTLVEEDEDDEASDDEMSEYDELTESDDLDEGDEAEKEAHEALRRQLLRLVYQGCDLFVAPPPPPQPSLMLHL